MEEEDEAEVFESWLRAAARVSDHVQRTPNLGSELLGRFVVKRRLGAGGMGIVFAAFDRVRNAHVALKMLSRADASSTYRLKKEFRALADVIHPNLIRLHELFVTEEQSFFTMDLLEGRTLLDHIGGAPADARAHVLRSAFQELAIGVDAIHRAGKLHRDLKPSNVLVTTEGRVVILDFGLADDAIHQGQQTIEDGVLGTPAYMAPEQARAEPATVASDWYAIGVMLYEALTGQVPFEGSVYEILAAKQTNEPPVPIAHASAAIPADLGGLCQELMRLEPSERPSADRVLATLGPAGVQVRSRASVTKTVFVGRAGEMRALRDAVAATDNGKPGVIYLHGVSGVGKTALIDAFVRDLKAQSRALVLRGRCYERESLPFKALDTLIDDLSRHLRSISDLEVARVTPRHVHALLRVFPVLERVGQLATAVARTALPENPLEVRRRAFAALSQLLGNLADARQLVLIIDDLQWADDDSALLLCDLLRPPNSPALLFLGCYRSDEVERRRPLQTLLTLRAGDSGVDTQDLPLGPLSDEESRQLVSALLADDRETRPVAIHDAHGNPFFLTELVRFVQLERQAAPASAREVVLTVEQMLDARRRRLPTEAQRLLEFACVAGRPTAVTTFAAALAGRVDVRLTADLLRGAGLLRAAGDPTAELVAPYHDRIREAVLSGLGAGARAGCHLELANAIESSEQPDLDALLEHLVAARESSRASLLAGRMAVLAESSFAFERAAELYSVALSHYSVDEPASRRRIELLLARANALRVCFLKEGTRPDPSVTLIELYTQGAGNESYRSFAEAGVRAHALEDAALMAQAALQSDWERRNLPYMSRHRDFREASRETLLSWALQAARGEDSARHVSLLSEMAIVLRVSPDYGRAEQCCREAAAMADRLGDPVARLEALRARTHLSQVVDTPPKQSLALATTLLSSAQSAGSMTYQADAHFLRLFALTELGEFSEATSEAEAVGDLLSSEAWTDRHGSISSDRVVWSISLVWKAMRLAMQGHFEDAQRLIRSGPFFAPPNAATLTLNAISMLRGRTQKLANAFEAFIETEGYRRDDLQVFADLESHLRAVSEPPAKGEFPQMDVTLRSMLASMHVDNGRGLQARAQFERLAAQNFQDLPREFSWLSAMNGIVKTCVYLNDKDRAERLYPMLGPFEDRMIVLSQYNFCFGSFARCLGELATMLGLWSEATRHFEYALRRNTDIGARPFVAMTQAGLARMLLMRGAAADKAAAQALLAQSSGIARELGMAPLEREIAQLRAQ